MKIKRVLWFLASVALAAALVALLIRMGKVDVGYTIHRLQKVNLLSLIPLLLLNAMLVYLSTVKWSMVDAELRRSTDAVPSRVATFFMTSAGMALGLILPVQLGMAVARTIGTHAYGRAIKRGTAGTIFEQGFDFLATLFLAAASWFTWLMNGDGLLWSLSVVVLIFVGLITVGPVMDLVRWLFRLISAQLNTSESAHLGTGAHQTRSWIVDKVKKPLLAMLANFAELQHSGLLNPNLGRRLLLISTIRFGVVALMAKQTAIIFGSQIALWRMAAAIPFATLVNVLGITPGGIGVNELTSVTALHLFGTPIQIASEWALANRLLGTLSCFTVAVCAFIVLEVSKMLNVGSSNANPEPR